MFEQNEIMAETIISTFKSLDKVEEQIKYVLVLLYQLDMANQEKFQEQILEFENYFSDIEFMKLVRYRDALVKDYSAEYFGRDYGIDDPFLFNKELEQKINEISMKIMATLGLIIKSMKESIVNIPDDT